MAIISSNFIDFFLVQTLRSIEGMVVAKVYIPIYVCLYSSFKVMMIYLFFTLQNVPIYGFILKKKKFVEISVYIYYDKFNTIFPK